MNTTLRTALETAYINGATASSLAYRPQFVSNNHKEGKKVLSSVEDELLACDQFQISVAFITMSGITPLLQTLKELEKKNIPGEILTTNYLNFSEPRALKKLNELQNITLKMYDVEAAKEGFHTKGYIFKKEEIYRIIIGSSNITSAALTYNRNGIRRSCQRKMVRWRGKSYRNLIRCGTRSMHWILTHFMNHIGKNIRSSSISVMLRSWMISHRLKNIS